jgi:hypothetical protein
MMNRILVIGIVGVLLVAGFLAFFPSGGGEGGDDAAQFSAKIFIEEIGTNELAEAELDLGAPDTGELMMLAFGQGIRGTDITLASTPGDGGGNTPNVFNIRAGGTYAVWLVVTIKVGATNLSSTVINYRVESSALVNMPLDAFDSPISTANPYFYGLYGMSSADKVAYMEGTTGPDTTVTADLSKSVMGKFDQKCEYDGSPVSALYGANIDLMKFTVKAQVNGHDGVNNRYASVTADISLYVGSWVTGSVNVQITNITVGTPTSLSIEPGMCMSDLDMAKVAA